MKPELHAVHREPVMYDGWNVPGDGKPMLDNHVGVLAFTMRIIQGGCCRTDGLIETPIVKPAVKILITRLTPQM